MFAKWFPGSYWPKGELTYIIYHQTLDSHLTEIPNSYYLEMERSWREATLHVCFTICLVNFNGPKECLWIFTVYSSFWAQVYFADEKKNKVEWMPIGEVLGLSTKLSYAYGFIKLQVQSKKNVGRQVLEDGTKMQYICKVFILMKSRSLHVGFPSSYL